MRIWPLERTQIASAQPEPARPRPVPRFGVAPNSLRIAGAGASTPLEVIE
jgi:hypothetical protein